MDLLTHSLMVVLGATIGSFLNVVILREENGERITGRSHCPWCKKALTWYELVPILSFLLQRGKCRTCHAPLSVQYPLVEVLTAIVFVAVYYHLGSFDVLSTSYKLQATSFSAFYFLLSTFFHCATWSALIAIFVYDFRTKIIPDRFNIIFAALAFCAVLVDTLSATSYQLQATSFEILGWHIIAGILLFLPFYAVWKFSDGRWMGLGDGKLVVGFGFLLGLVGGFSAVMFGFWVGAVTMLILMGVQRLLACAPTKLQATSYKLGLKSEIPFGPFLVVGTAIVYFTGTTFLTLFW